MVIDCDAMRNHVRVSGKDKPIVPQDRPSVRWYSACLRLRLRSDAAHRTAIRSSRRALPRDTVPRPLQAKQCPGTVAVGVTCTSTVPRPQQQGHITRALSEWRLASLILRRPFAALRAQLLAVDAMPGHDGQRHPLRARGAQVAVERVVTAVLAGRRRFGDEHVASPMLSP
jgi:hypothetical protein